jgi:hypothetical protein
MAEPGNFNTFIGGIEKEEVAYNNSIREFAELPLQRRYKGHLILNHRDPPKDAVIDGYLTNPAHGNLIANIVKTLYILKPECGVCGPGVKGAIGARGHIIERIFNTESILFPDIRREEFKKASAHGVALDLQLGIQYVFTDASHGPEKYMGKAGGQRVTCASPTNLIDSASINTTVINNVFLNIPVQTVASEAHLKLFGFRFVRKIKLYNLNLNRSENTINEILQNVNENVSRALNERLRSPETHFCATFDLNEIGVPLPFGSRMILLYDANQDEMSTVDEYENPIEENPRTHRKIFAAGNSQKNRALSRILRSTRPTDIFYKHFLLELKNLGDANHCIWLRQICDATEEPNNIYSEAGVVARESTNNLINRANSAFGTPDYDVTLRFVLEGLGVFYFDATCVNYYPGGVADPETIARNIREQRLRDFKAHNKDLLERFEEFNVYINKVKSIDFIPQYTSIVNPSKLQRIRNFVQDTLGRLDNLLVQYETSVPQGEVNAYCARYSLPHFVINNPKKGHDNNWVLLKTGFAKGFYTKILGIVQSNRVPEPMNFPEPPGAIPDAAAAAAAADNLIGGGIPESFTEIPNQITYILLTEFSDILKFGYAMYLAHGIPNQNLNEFFKQAFYQKSVDNILYKIRFENNILFDENMYEVCKYAFFCVEYYIYNFNGPPFDQELLLKLRNVILAAIKFFKEKVQGGGAKRERGEEELDEEEPDEEEADTKRQKSEEEGTIEEAAGIMALSSMVDQNVSQFENAREAFLLVETRPPYTATEIEELKEEFKEILKENTNQYENENESINEILNRIQNTTSGGTYERKSGLEFVDLYNLEKSLVIKILYYLSRGDYILTTLNKRREISPVHMLVSYLSEEVNMTTPDAAAATATPPATPMKEDNATPQGLITPRPQRKQPNTLPSTVKKEPQSELVSEENEEGEPPAVAPATAPAPAATAATPATPPHVNTTSEEGEDSEMSLLGSQEEAEVNGRDIEEPVAWTLLSQNQLAKTQGNSQEETQEYSPGLPQGLPQGLPPGLITPVAAHRKRKHPNTETRNQPSNVKRERKQENQSDSGSEEYLQPIHRRYNNRRSYRKRKDSRRKN